MSLTTDGLALGAAFAVVVGSAIQVKQAYSELNAKAPARYSIIPLLLVGIGAALSASPGSSAMGAKLMVDNIRSFTAMLTKLTPEQVAELPPGRAAALAAGTATALTDDQTKALAAGKPVTLTDDQADAMAAEQVNEVKKWLGWLLGWLFILVGALAAAAGAFLTLKQDL